LVPARGFPDMAGDWSGTTVYYDWSGKSVVRKKLFVNCRIDGNAMHIKNTYAADDGTTVVANVRGEFDAQGRYHINSETSEGVAWESDGNILASWRSKLDPQVTYVELATLKNGYRTRTWHHFRNGQLEGVTVFEERKAAQL
jgi:hypothetical protein